MDYLNVVDLDEFIDLSNMSLRKIHTIRSSSTGL